MGYERYPRHTTPLGDGYGWSDPEDIGNEFRTGRPYGTSSARDYEAAGELGRGRGGYGRPQGQQGYGRQDYGRGDYDRGSSQPYRGSYAADGHRFTDVGANRDREDDERNRQYRGPASDQDRGFFARAGDEVRSWFGDDEAERRRDADARYDNHRDRDYHSWRSGQIASLDRDYDEYRQENRSKFENEFHSWRTERQGQRSALSKVNEHMEVVGSDGEHVGTVDKVQGDRILLTKSDADAGGRHHSIPSRWIESVDDKVQIRKTADEAKSHWRDEERSGALFGDNAEGERAGSSLTSSRNYSNNY